ncbi:MAG: phosphate ABC transporter substrate-binding protein [Gammaproteobacteria bacterium]|nr:phosphate ABC transporter substrate-binding protein [Gammaproteobacteria bacterium]
MKTMKLKSLLLGLTFTLGLITFPLQAGVVVIGHVSNNASLDSKQIARIFLGKATKFPGGAKAAPVDQAPGSAARTDFYNKVVGKGEAKVKAYWNQRIFAGKGKGRPKEIGDGAAVKSWVSSHPKAIGYIDSSLVDDSVKVLFSAD